MGSQIQFSSNVGSYIADKKELNRFIEWVDGAIEDADVAEKLIQYLSDNPGAKQNILGKKLNESGRKTSSIVRSLQHLNWLRREPNGNTYDLYLTEQAKRPS